MMLTDICVVEFTQVLSGPFAGAIFSGIAALILAMAIIRRVLHLEEYLRPVHFNNLGLLLLTMSLIWFYFTFGEYLTAWY